jgi:hypothetical protein
MILEYDPGLPRSSREWNEIFCVHMTIYILFLSSIIFRLRETKLCKLPLS